VLVPYCGGDAHRCGVWEGGRLACGVCISETVCVYKCVCVLVPCCGGDAHRCGVWEGGRLACGVCTIETVCVYECVCVCVCVGAIL
jgi:hypothetical protein